MSAGPTFDDIFAVMSAASVGDTGARVILPDDLDVEDPAAKLAVALNLLLDDWPCARTSSRRPSSSFDKRRR
jgi:hypothetical protein